MDIHETNRNALECIKLILALTGTSLDNVLTLTRVSGEARAPGRLQRTRIGLSKVAGKRLLPRNPPKST